MTMNVSASTIGPPSSVPFSIGQNAVQWTNTQHQLEPRLSALRARSPAAPSSPAASARPVPWTLRSAQSSAVLLFGANNVTIDHNTITGWGDLGISVTAGTANATISFNAINRPEPPDPDPYGIGVSVDPDLGGYDQTDLQHVQRLEVDIEPETLTQEAVRRPGDDQDGLHLDGHPGRTGDLHPHSP